MCVWDQGMLLRVLGGDDVLAASRTEKGLLSVGLATKSFARVFKG